MPDCWSCRYFEYNPLSKRYLCYLPLCLGLSPHPEELSVSDILRIQSMVRGCDGYTPKNEKRQCEIQRLIFKAENGRQIR